MSATAETARGTELKTDRRTLIALGAGLVVTLWMADQIEMDLFMAFVWRSSPCDRLRSEQVGRARHGRGVPGDHPALFHDSGSGFIEDMTLALAYTVMALGLNIIVGFAGLLDLGYVAFFAFGALTSGWFMSGFFVNAGGGEGWSLLRRRARVQPARRPPEFPAGLGDRVGVTTTAGMLIGLPTLRLRGDYIAIVTLAFGEIIGRIAINGDEITSPGRSSPTAARGSRRSTRSTCRSSSPSPALELRPWYFVALGLVVLVLFVNFRLRDSRLGRAWVALREDEVAAASWACRSSRPS